MRHPLLGVGRTLGIDLRDCQIGEGRHALVGRSIHDRGQTLSCPEANFPHINLEVLWHLLNKLIELAEESGDVPFPEMLPAAAQEVFKLAGFETVVVVALRLGIQKDLDWLLNSTNVILRCWNRREPFYASF